jgi:hypothetical protein
VVKQFVVVCPLHQNVQQMKIQDQVDQAVVF